MRLGPLAALLLASAAACGGAPCPPARATANVDRRPFLWEVSGERGKVVLYGTFHVAGKQHIPGLALDRLRASRLFVSEIPPVSLAAQPTSALPPGESLEEKLGPTAWGELSHALSGVMAAAELRRAQPWVAMAALTAVAIDSPEVPMDAALVDVARRRGMRFSFLESPEEQAEALAGAVTVDDLRTAIAERRGMRCAVQDLLGAYRAGDGQALREALAGGAEAKLLLERNRRWLPIVEDLMSDDAFVAVGVSHLVGGGSLPELLAARGHHVTRLGP